MSPSIVYGIFLVLCLPSNIWARVLVSVSEWSSGQRRIKETGILWTEPQSNQWGNQVCQFFSHVTRLASFLLPWLQNPGIPAFSHTLTLKYCSSIAGAGLPGGEMCKKGSLAGWKWKKKGGGGEVHCFKNLWRSLRKLLAEETKDNRGSKIWSEAWCLKFFWTLEIRVGGLSGRGNGWMGLQR